MKFRIKILLLISWFPDFLISCFTVGTQTYSQQNRNENTGNRVPPEGTIKTDTIDLGYNIYAFQYFNGEKYAYGSSIEKFPAKFEYDSIEFTSYDTIGPYVYEPFLFAEKNGK